MYSFIYNNECVQISSNNLVSPVKKTPHINDMLLDDPIMMSDTEITCLYAPILNQPIQNHYTEKKYITNGDNNIIIVRSMSIILLIFISDVRFL